MITVNEDWRDGKADNLKYVEFQHRNRPPGRKDNDEHSDGSGKSQCGQNLTQMHVFNIIAWERRDAHQF